MDFDMDDIPLPTRILILNALLLLNEALRQQSLKSDDDAQALTDLVTSFLVQGCGREARANVFPGGIGQNSFPSLSSWSSKTQLPSELIATLIHKMDAHSFSVEDVHDVLNAYKSKFGVQSLSPSQSVQDQHPAPSQLFHETKPPPQSPSQSVHESKSQFLHKQANPKLAESKPGSELDGEWRIQFDALTVYKSTYGDCKVPKGYKDRNLARWVINQRNQYSKLENGKKSILMTRERIKMLNAIGFVWDPLGKKWNDHFHELKDFYEKNGHSGVDKGENPKLAQWVSEQRHKYRFLPQEKIEMLNAIGFVLDKNEANWMEAYQELVKFKNEFGHCKVTGKYNGNLSLMAWVKRQRKLNNERKAGKQTALTPERIDLLDGLGFDWVGGGGVKINSDKKWNDRFHELKHFHQNNGHCLVDKGENPKLAQWVSGQRSDYRRLQQGKNIKTGNQRITLTQERIEMLNAIGFVWDPLGKKWNDHFHELKDFYEKNGHWVIPKGENPELAHWVTHLRYEYRQGKKTITLTQERIEMLNAIRFPWEPRNN